MRPALSPARSRPRPGRGMTVTLRPAAGLQGETPTMCRQLVRPCSRHATSSLRTNGMRRRTWPRTVASAKPQRRHTPTDGICLEPTGHALGERPSRTPSSDLFDLEQHRGRLDGGYVYYYVHTIVPVIEVPSLNFTCTPRPTQRSATSVIASRFPRSVSVHAHHHLKVRRQAEVTSA